MKIINRLSPASGPATGSFDGLHPKSDFLAFILALAVLWISNTTATAASQPPIVEPTPRSIPLDQLGAKADAQGTTGDIVVTREGARLRAPMQDLEAEAKADGLWLSSVADKDLGKPHRFRIRALSMGRRSTVELPPSGTVRVGPDSVVWQRMGLVEEYRVSSDGVRQDFLINQPPVDEAGELVVDLEVSGARVEAACYGAKLTVGTTGREIAYSRLHVTDATGRELAARMEILSEDRLRVVVEDHGATYPVRVDPTFSDADWISMGSPPGVDLYVHAMAVDSLGNLYLGGDFSSAGGVPVNRIAKWDGQSWSALGSGIGGVVYALSVRGTDLYVGGNFATAGGIQAQGIAKWDGSAWSALGSGIGGVSSVVHCFAWSGDDLYVGGSFSTAGLSVGSGVAKWDGANWTALGEGVNGRVEAMAVAGGNLYVGGSFSAAGGMPAQRIAKWNGSTWSALGSGLFRDIGFGPTVNGATVSALSVFEGNLYVGGYFGKAGSISVANVACWDGGSWSGVGSGLPGGVSSLAVFQNSLYAGGGFTSSGGAMVNRVARWNGVDWLQLGTGLDAGVRVLLPAGNELYAGGFFSGLPNDPAADPEMVTFGYVARWSGSDWFPLSSGLSGPVTALASSDGKLYVGGDFTRAGGQKAIGIAMWDGNRWSPLGPGLNGVVYSLAVVPGGIVAGGDFTMAGDTEVNAIAKWDGVQWTALGQGLEGSDGAYVFAVTTHADDLYAGGMFGTAGGVVANNVARWDGSEWHPLGQGVNDAVASLLVSEESLFVGGAFTSAGSNPASRIARWSGTTWSPLGSGCDGNVLALAEIDGSLYVGGNFSFAGGVYTPGIARWDDNLWSDLGAWPNGYVRTLAVANGELLVGGGFSAIYNWTGSTPANNISAWNGSEWLELGSGFDLPVEELLVANGSLFVGGGFNSAGGKISNYLARANLSGAIPVITSGSIAWGVVGSTLTYQVTADNNPTEFTATGIPPGLNLDGTTGIISGIPSVAGQFTLTLSAINASGADVRELTLNLVVPQTIDAWRQQNFGTTEDSGDAADLATPDGDGITNLMKYALVLISGENASGSLPDGELVGNEGSRFLALSFRRDPARRDVTISVESTGDPAQGWAELARSESGSPFTGITDIKESPAGDGTVNVQVSDTFETSTASQRFMRVRVLR